jgi:hypothetical protein
VPGLRRLVVGFPQWWPGSAPANVTFVVNAGPPGQEFAEPFRFSYKFSFHRLLHIHHHPSSGAGTVGQTVAHVPRALSLTSTHKFKEKLFPGLYGTKQNK